MFVFGFWYIEDLFPVSANLAMSFFLYVQPSKKVVLRFLNIVFFYYLFCGSRCVCFTVTLSLFMKSPAWNTSHSFDPFKLSALYDV